MNARIKKQFSVVYSRVCFAESLVQEAQNKLDANYDDLDKEKLARVKKLLREATASIAKLLKAKMPKCPRCGARVKGGICLNYGCEGKYKTS